MPIPTYRGATTQKHSGFLLCAIVFVRIHSQCFAQAASAFPAPVTANEVIVTGESLPDSILQSAPVGPYGQPEWTTIRSFGASRIYVRPPGTMEFVNFWTAEWKEGDSEHNFRDELEIGLPHRFQL